MSFFKRMGSASSQTRNAVRSMSIDPDGKTVASRIGSGGSGRSASGKTTDHKEELKHLNEQLVNVQVLLEQAQKQNGNLKETIDKLSLQVQSLERENEQLVEQNQALEDQVEEEGEGAMKAFPDMSGSLKQKEQEIVKLETELKSCEDDMVSLRQKCKAKLKTLRTNHSKSKQENSLKMFELKDEIAVLTQENKQLRGKLEALGHSRNSIDSNEVDNYSEKSSSPTGGKSDIIIELSTHISEQESKLSVLESQLEEKDLLIAKLQSSTLSPRDAHSIIAVEAEKATLEMQSLAKELKMLKRKKKRAKAEDAVTLSASSEYNREFSSLSRDSGAADLSSPNRLLLEDNRVRHKVRGVDSYGLVTQNHSNTAFPNSSTLVT